MKKAFIISLFLAGALFISACNNNTNDTGGTETDTIRLSTPKVSYADGTIYWAEVKNADKYEVSINNTINITYFCNYTLPLSYENQDFEIKVKAVSEDYRDSEFSNTLSFSAKIILPVETLSVEIMNENDRISISWSETNCDEYIVSINDKQFSAKSTTFLTSSDEYIAGMNTISVQPKGDDYDITPAPATTTVEKSLPLNDLSNIRIEGGKLLYGENSVYDTSFIPAGENYTFTLSNIEDGKIKSDGPSFTAYKLIQPKITRATKDYYSEYPVIIEGIAPDDCKTICYELYSTEDILIASGTTSFIDYPSREFHINIDDLNSAYSPDYVKITSIKEGMINSETLVKELTRFIR